MGLPDWCGARTVDEHLANGGTLDAAHPESGWTPLHYAAEREDADLVRELVAKGANLEARDSKGWTPLHFAVDIAIDGAAQENRPMDFALVRSLITMGARLDALSNDGKTPRDVAKAYGESALHLFDETVANAR